MAFTVRGFMEPLNRAFSAFQGKAIRDTYGYAVNSYKTVAQAFTTTTFTELSGLSVDLVPGAHRVTFIIATPTMTAAGGIKFQLVGTNGLAVGTVAMSAYYWLTGVAPAVTPITALSSSVNGGTTNAWTSVLITGTIEVTQQGTLTIQSAQQAASGTTNVAIGSSVDTQQLTLAK
jgi:hypothetical protein